MSLAHKIAANDENRRKCEKAGKKHLFRQKRRKSFPDNTTLNLLRKKNNFILCQNCFHSLQCLKKKLCPWKHEKTASKVAKPVQIQPKSQFLFHKNLSPCEFSIMTLSESERPNFSFYYIDAFLVPLNWSTIYLSVRGIQKVTKLEISRFVQSNVAI